MRRVVGALGLGLALAAIPVAAQAPADGAAIYAKYCSQCHGDQGDGVGIATPYLKPAPRDFTSGKYKVRRTPTGSLPLDEDLDRVVRVGLPTTGMPAFGTILNETQIKAVVAHIKSFSPDFADPELKPEPFEIPTPPAYSEQSAELGKQVYVETGCARCHGNIGYGDGASAPTLVDDWGVHIRPADLSMPWTFRAGGTREDIFRTMSAGFNGTPMPGFHGSLEVEKIWAIVDYVVSLSGNTTEAPYGTLLKAVGTDEPLDLAQGAALFAKAPKTTFPIVGQVMEKGRNFYPSAVAIEAQAIFNSDEIAIRLTWHDMRAETSGSNAPDLQVEDGSDLAQFLPKHAGGGAGAAAEESGDVWGDAAVTDEGGGDDVWGDAAAEEPASGGDFWGEEGASETAAPAGPDTEFSDAVALQLPLTLPTGVRLPYFLFGDAQNPVELWFADLAQPQAAKTFLGRGSTAIAPGEGEPPEMVASYEDGVWSVIFKRSRKLRSGVAFNEGSFVPVAFSVWDGFNRERGNKRGLTAWYFLYLEPLEQPSPVGPMMRAGAIVLGLELLIVALVRRRHRKNQEAHAAGVTQPAGA